MKITKRQLQRIIKEEILQEKKGKTDWSELYKKGVEGYKKATKAKKAVEKASQTKAGRKVGKKVFDYAEKKASEAGYGDEAGVGRELAASVGGFGGAKAVEDTDIEKSKMRLLARQAKYGKKGLKTPTGMPIGDVEIKEEDGEQVYLFMDDEGEDVEVYRDRGDAVYHLVDESIAKNDPTLSESRIRLRVRYYLRG